MQHGERQTHRQTWVEDGERGTQIEYMERQRDSKTEMERHGQKRGWREGEREGKGSDHFQQKDSDNFLQKSQLRVNISATNTGRKQLPLNTNSKDCSFHLHFKGTAGSWGLEVFCKEQES